MSVLRQVLVAAPTGRLHPHFPITASVVSRAAREKSPLFENMREYKLSATFECFFLAKNFEDQFSKAQDYIIHHVFGEFYPLIMELRHALNSCDVDKAIELADKLHKQMFIE